MGISGIYKITNVKNGRIYIGSSYNIQKRWKGHAAALRCGKHTNRFLQNDYNKCGADAFVYEVVESTDHLDQNGRLALEEEYILKYYDHGQSCYNLCNRAVAGGGKLKDPASTKHKLSVVSQEHWDDEDWRTNQIRLINEALSKPGVKEKRQASLIASWAGNEKRSKEQSEKMRAFHENNPEISERVTQVLLENQPKGRVTFKERMKTDVEFREIYIRTGKTKAAKFNKRYAEDPEYKAMMDAKSIENIKRFNEQKMASMPCKPPIVAPDGTVYSDVKSINQFAKDHDLDSSSLYQLFNGRIKTCRGWKLLTPIIKPDTTSGPI